MKFLPYFEFKNSKPNLYPILIFEVFVFLIILFIHYMLPTISNLYTVRTNPLHIIHTLSSHMAFVLAITGGVLFQRKGLLSQSHECLGGLR